MEKDDKKTLDLIVNYGEAFPKLDNSGKEIVPPWEGRALLINYILSTIHLSPHSTFIPKTLTVHKCINFIIFVQIKKISS